MKKIVIAPDSFKGSLSSVEVARALADGWRRGRPGDEVIIAPLADGGEGTLTAIEAGGGWEWQEVPATDPIGRPNRRATTLRCASLGARSVIVPSISRPFSMRSRIRVTSHAASGPPSRVRRRSRSPQQRVNSSSRSAIRALKKGLFECWVMSTGGGFVVYRLSSASGGTSAASCSISLGMSCAASRQIRSSAISS